MLKVELGCLNPKMELMMEREMSEQTLIVIKPDAFERKLTGLI